MNHHIKDSILRKMALRHEIQCMEKSIAKINALMDTYNDSTKERALATIANLNVSIDKLLGEIL